MNISRNAQVVISTILLSVAAWALDSAACAQPEPVGWGCAPGRHPPYQKEFLKQILNGAKDTVIVFDLDHTLLDDRTRQMQIFLSFTASSAHGDRLAKLLFHLPACGVRYRIDDTLTQSPLLDATLLADIAELKTYWKQYFHTDEFAKLDIPIRGASAYVRSLWQQGAFIVYLSGRPAAIAEGTRSRLRHWGFPIDDGRSMLILKQDAAESDSSFKARSLASIDRVGSVSAYFENQPANLSLMAKHWPQGKPIFLNTDRDLHDITPVPPNAAWIPDFADD